MKFTYLDFRTAMSTPRGDNDRQTNNNAKKRASVAARMALHPISKGQQGSSIVNQLAHLQEHPLLEIGRGSGPSASTSSNNNSRQRGNTQRNNNASNTTNQQKHHNRPMSPTRPNYFGADIPENVMEDLLFRFLYNIPENEKNVRVRVCFQVEQAHWFFVDFYCSAENNPTNLCKKLGFREFTRQVFYKCDYLLKWKDQVEEIIDEFRIYKSNVPTYGVIMLDSSLNYVLLVQGYYASKNSWGFPKGKVNEEEIPIQCAIREAYEEVGFDATDHIVPNCRPLQCLLNDTLIRLYIAVDVPMDHPFEPHLRKEIRKIAWFSVWDLPKDRFDDQSCKKLGLTPNNFYSVLSFVNGIQAFVKREQAKRQKPKVTIMRKDSSAFNPVVPKGGSAITEEDLLGFVQPTSSSAGLTDTSSMSALQRTDELNAFLFKPLCPDLEMLEPQTSYTGEAFLQKFFNAASTSKSSKTPSTSQEQQLSSVSGIKQPKPIHSNLVIQVYEAPPSESSTPVPCVQQQQQPAQQSQQQKQQLPQQKLVAATTSQTSKKQSKNIINTATNTVVRPVGTCVSVEAAGIQTTGTSGLASVKRTLDQQTQTEIDLELSLIVFDRKIQSMTDKNTQTDFNLSPLELEKRQLSTRNHPSENLRQLFALINPSGTASQSQSQIPTLPSAENELVFEVALCKAWQNFTFQPLAM